MNDYYDPRLIMPRQQNAYPPYVWFQGILSPPECAGITALAEACVLEDGKIGNGNSAEEAVVSHSYRKVETCGLMPHYELSGSRIDWLFERIRDKVIWANENHYHFDLHGLWQQINFLRYRAATKPGEENGHYDSHQDYGGGTSSQRKLSLVVQLSNPADYDGCRLLLHNEKEFDPGHIGQGDMIVFPSWQVHRVTDITRGERRALVSWVSGPPFR